MNKVVENGHVKVLYSPGYGAGWYSWHGKKDLLFDPIIIGLVEKDKRDQKGDLTNNTVNAIKDYCEKKYPGSYFGGADQLEIGLVTEGVEFKISEYDGYESIELGNDRSEWITA